MAVKHSAGLLASLFLCLLTGCWDRHELNDRLFDLGSGIDQQEDGTHLVSAQYMIPTKSGESGSSSGQSYFIETSSGKNAFDGILNMQQKLSRKISRGHRRNLFIGEPLAKAGFSNMLDSLTRDPESRIRTDIWVVKGDTALELLKMPYPLEKLPAMAALKIRQAIGTKTGSSFMDYLISASGEGSSPTLPAVEIEKKPALDKKTIKFYGRAIFNQNHKLVGYYNMLESSYRLWMIGQMNNIPLTTDIPNENVMFSVNVTHAKRKIHTFIDSGKVKIEIELSGKAIVRENNTSLDLTDIKNLKKFEEAFNRDTEKKILQVIQKTQKKFKADVFGFGETISRQHPTEWKSLKPEWEHIFPEAKVTVHSQVMIRRIGLQGPPLNPSK